MRGSLVCCLVLAMAAGADAAIKSVMLLSIDGMHPSDLANYIQNNPHGALARLAAQGTTYSNAFLKNAPADSFPGLAALVTGGTPKTTGIWYDDSYDRSLSPPLDASDLANGRNGDATCSVTGTELLLADSLDVDATMLSGGSGTNIDKLVRNGTNGCAPVFPNQIPYVNNIFAVVKANNGSTAWSDKHTAAYRWLQGPSNTSIDTYYSPEVASLDSSNMSYAAYDAVKAATINAWIQGKNLSAGQTSQPTLFGGNFQNFNHAQGAGYQSGTTGGFTPKLAAAMNATDTLINGFLNSLEAAGTLSTTAIIIAAKHGQNPLNPSKFNQISPDVLNTTISAVDPAEPAGLTLDSAALIWLRNQSNLMPVVAAIKAAKAQLAYTDVLYGASLRAAGFGNPNNSSRVPDIIIRVPAGVTYTTGTALSNHGGFSSDDTNVGLLIAIPGSANATVTRNVTSTQVAPTVLHLLGFNTSGLDAVKAERTAMLPGLPSTSSSSSAASPAAAPVTALLAPASAASSAAAPGSSPASSPGSSSTSSGASSASPSGAPAPAPQGGERTFPDNVVLVLMVAAACLCIR